MLLSRTRTRAANSRPQRYLIQYSYRAAPSIRAMEAIRCRSQFALHTSTQCLMLATPTWQHLCRTSRQPNQSLKALSCSITVQVRGVNRNGQKSSIQEPKRRPEEASANRKRRSFNVHLGGDRVGRGIRLYCYGSVSLSEVDVQ